MVCATARRLSGEVGDDNRATLASLLASNAIRNPLNAEETLVNNIVYIVGAVVIIVALLSFFGLR